MIEYGFNDLSQVRANGYGSISTLFTILDFNIQYSSSFENRAFYCRDDWTLVFLIVAYAFLVVAGYLNINIEYFTLYFFAMTKTFSHSKIFCWLFYDKLKTFHFLQQHTHLQHYIAKFSNTKQFIFNKIKNISSSKLENFFF